MAGPSDVLGQLHVAGGDHRRGGVALGNLARQVGAGQDRDALRRQAGGLGDNLVHPLERSQFKALRQGQDRDIVREGGTGGLQGGAHRADGDGYDDQAPPRHGLGDVRGRINAIREGDTRQVRRVLVAIDEGDRVGVAPPHGDRHSRVGEDLGERGSPCSRSQYRCR